MNQVPEQFAFGVRISWRIIHFVMLAKKMLVEQQKPTKKRSINPQKLKQFKWHLGSPAVPGGLVGAAVEAADGAAAVAGCRLPLLPPLLPQVSSGAPPPKPKPTANLKHRTR